MNTETWFEINCKKGKQILIARVRWKYQNILESKVNKAEINKTLAMTTEIRGWGLCTRYCHMYFTWILWTIWLPPTAKSYVETLSSVPRKWLYLNEAIRIGHSPLWLRLLESKGHREVPGMSMPRGETCDDTERSSPSPNHGKPSENTKPAYTLILDYWPPETGEIKFLLFKLFIQCYFTMIILAWGK